MGVAGWGGQGGRVRWAGHVLSAVFKQWLAIMINNMGGWSTLVSFDFQHFISWTPLCHSASNYLSFSLCIYDCNSVIHLSTGPVYLFGALPDQGGEFCDDEVDAFHTRVFQLNDLFFHYGLKCQVWREQACPVVRHQGSRSFNVRRR